MALYKCAKYNQTNLTPPCTHLETCERYGRCRHCFAVYGTNEQGEILPKIFGCAGIGHTCNKENIGRCVLENRVRHTHYCCCYGDFCNRNVTVVRENLTPEPTLARPTLSMRQELGALRSNNILFYVLPPLFGLIILLAVIKKVHGKHKHKHTPQDAPPLLPVATPPHTPPLRNDPIHFQEVNINSRTGKLIKPIQSQLGIHSLLS